MEAAHNQLIRIFENRAERNDDKIKFPKRINPQIDFYNFFADKNIEYMMWLDYQRRRQSDGRRFPQTALHFKNPAAAKLGKWAPRHPCGLPAFYYERWQKNKIWKYFGVVQEIVRTPDRRNDREWKMRISNSHAQIIESIPNDITRNDLLISFNDSKNLERSRDFHEVGKKGSIASEEEDVEFRIEDGRIYNKKREETVPTRLNGKLIGEEDDQKIKKAEFHLSKDSGFEILVLFEAYFMAGGIIRKTKEGCFEANLFEMSGTYGTTDFVASPDFRSMLRKSQMPQEPVAPRDSSVVEEELQSIRRHLLRRFNALGIAERKKQNEVKLCHSDEDGKSFCQLFHGFIETANSFQTRRIQREIQEKKMTAREVIIMLQSEAVEAKDPQETCTNWECKNFDSLMLLITHIFSDPSSLQVQGEILVEFLVQLKLVLDQFFVYLEENDGCPIAIMQPMSSVRQFYTLDLAELIKNFSAVPICMRSYALEAICSRATSQTAGEVIKLYETEPEMVLEALKRHPHILLFGQHRLSPPIELIKRFGAWKKEELERFEKSIKKVEAPVLRKVKEEVEEEDQMEWTDFQSTEYERGLRRADYLKGQDQENVPFQNGGGCSQVPNTAPEDEMEEEEEEIEDVEVADLSNGLDSLNREFPNPEMDVEMEEASIPQPEPQLEMEEDQIPNGNEVVGNPEDPEERPEAPEAEEDPEEDPNRSAPSSFSSVHLHASDETDSSSQKIRTRRRGLSIDQNEKT